MDSLHAITFGGAAFLVLWAAYSLTQPGLW